jgi:glyoxylase-like metal-dependent hydrolase (beta-lactamase superfamily II)
MSALVPTPVGDVQRLALAPRAALNAYLVGDVVVDAGMPGQGAAIVRMLGERSVRRHVLTHPHLDHAGGSAHVCRAFGLEGTACGSLDLTDLRAGRSPELALRPRLRPLSRALGRYTPVEGTAFADGESVGPGFVVVFSPGHTPGHISLWRAADRVLIAGDALMGLDLLSGQPRLRLPPRFDQPDPVAVRASARRLAALEPQVVFFGHGPPMIDATPRLHTFAATLP